MVCEADEFLSEDIDGGQHFMTSISTREETDHQGEDSCVERHYCQVVRNLWSLVQMSAK
jgi:hypothetical protein